MKKYFIALSLLVASAAHSQGYIGLDYASGRVGVSCASNNVCSQKKGGYNIRFGTKLAEAYSLKIDDFSVDTIEVGLSKIGRVDAIGNIRQTVNAPSVNPPGTPNIVVTTATLPTQSSFSGNALYASLVARYLVVTDLAVYAKAGIALVSGTNSTKINNVSAGSVTENHWSPIVGIGAEYEVISGIKINSGFQALRVKSGVASGSVRQFTAGGQFSF